MQDWDLTSVGRVLIGGSITLAGTLITLLLPGVRITAAPLLLLTMTALLVMSAGIIIFIAPKNILPL
jgi:hypothetical protein